LLIKMMPRLNLKISLFLGIIRLAQYIIIPKNSKKQAITGN